MEGHVICWSNPASTFRCKTVDPAGEQSISDVPDSAADFPYGLPQTQGRKAANTEYAQFRLSPLSVIESRGNSLFSFVSQR